MKLFLAGDLNSISSEVMNKELERGINILSSFANLSKKEAEFIPYFQEFLLDSGAFTYLTSKKNQSVDWNGYIDRYIDFINFYKIKKFFELDIDKIIGYDKVKKLRQRLEAKTGRQSIAVLHNYRDLNECKALCRDYDYVALGGFVNKEIKKADYKYIRAIINLAHENGAKIHGLGFTNRKLLELYDFDSVDSSSWTTSARFGGQIYAFINDKLHTISAKHLGNYKNGIQLYNYSFQEWCKYMRYLERK